MVVAPCLTVKPHPDWWRSHQCMLWDLAVCCFLQWAAWSLTPILPAGHSWQCFLAVPRCSCLHLQQRALNSPRHCPAQLSLLPRTSHRRSRVRWHWWTVFLLWTWPAPPALHPPSVNLNAAVAQMTPAKQSTVQWVLLSPKWHLQNNPQFSEHCCHSNDTCKTIHSSISPVVTQMTPAKQSTVQWALLSLKWHLQNNPQFRERCCHPNDKTIHSTVNTVVTQMTPAKQFTVPSALLSPKWHLQNNSQFRQPCCHPNDTCKTIHSSVSPAGRDYHQKEERVIQAQYCKGAVSRHLLANLWIMLVLGTPSSFITQKCRHTSRCKHCKQKHANIVVINSIKQNKPCIHLSLDFSNDQKVL